MIFIYGEMRQNAIRAQSLYAERYPNRTHPSHCGIVGDQIIGPHFIDGNLTGERYAHFIRSRLKTLLENVPLNVR
ncbi:hypothetical protein WN55_03263 [Dufourea novaeangliae]|uniref:DUF4817 domain-containing protein n=1 Tax=Dufourea novaeangliae TaxID=178035 RepID=A0A154NXQ8_DUFNO|nr:hypothetical protein WN55_03263 [Dufourea novaeangliae]